MVKSPKPKKNSLSTTRKIGNKRSPKHFTDLEYLRDKKVARERASSFNQSTLSDEEFFKFFEEIGEVKKKTGSRSKRKTRRFKQIF